MVSARQAADRLPILTLLLHWQSPHWWCVCVSRVDGQPSMTYATYNKSVQLRILTGTLSMNSHTEFGDKVQNRSNLHQ